MNLTELQQNLIAATKAHPTNERVPYAFEKRVMAHLGRTPRVDLLGWWSRALWRGAAACVGVCILLTAWSILSFHREPLGDFSEALERTILASMNESDHGW
jgi:hypothetical protein